MITGQLADRPLPLLLQQLYAQRFTGELVINATTGMVQVYLRDGYPVYVSLPDARDVLGKILVEMKVLSDTGQRQGIATQQSLGERYGEVLLRLGLCDETQLKNGLRAQIRRKLLRLFALSHGGYAAIPGFHQRGLQGGESLRVHPLRIIYHGIRSWSQERLAPYLEPLLAEDSEFRLAPSAPTDLVNRFGFQKEEAYLVEILRKGFFSSAEFLQAAAQVPLPQGLSEAVLYALWVSASLEVGEIGSLPRGRDFLSQVQKPQTAMPILDLAALASAASMPRQGSATLKPKDIVQIAPAKMQPASLPTLEIAGGEEDRAEPLAPTRDQPKLTILDLGLSVDEGADGPLQAERPVAPRPIPNLGLSVDEGADGPLQAERMVAPRPIPNLGLSVDEGADGPLQAERPVAPRPIPNLGLSVDEGADGPLQVERMVNPPPIPDLGLRVGGPEEVPPVVTPPPPLVTLPPPLVTPPPPNQPALRPATAPNRSLTPAAVPIQSNTAPPKNRSLTPAAAPMQSNTAPPKNRSLTPAAVPMQNKPTTPAVQVVSPSKPLTPPGAPSTAPANRPLSAPRPTSTPGTGAAAPPPAKGGPRPVSFEEMALLRAEIENKAKVIEDETLFVVLGVPESAEDGQVKAAFLQAARKFHPDRIVAMGLQALKPQAEKIFRRVNEAHQVLTDPDKLAEYVAELKLKKESGDGAAAKERELAVKAVNAELAFSRGTVFLKKRDYVSAAREFEEAVLLNPNEGEHVAYLAWSKFGAGQLPAKEAIKDLQKAIQMDPKSGRLHYFLGIFFKQDDQEDKALASFTKAKELDKRLEEADSEIRLIQARRAKRGKGSTESKTSKPSVTTKDAPKDSKDKDVQDKDKKKSFLDMLRGKK